jgi:hypothetical protein
MRVEPTGSASTVELDDYDRALAELPQLAGPHFSEQGISLSAF